MELNVGDISNIKYPFYNQFTGVLDGKKEYQLTPGCHKEVCDKDAGWGSMESVYWIANFTGEICYEILSIAKMPGKYMDRIIIKFHYILPNGNKYSNGGITTLTSGKLKKTD